MTDQRGWSRREVLAGAVALGLSVQARVGRAEQAAGGAPGPLPTRRLGKTGYQDALVAFGGIALAPLSQAEATAAVHRALERGVTHFDVAPTYGDSETKIAPALAGGRRDQVFLACKTMERTKAGAARELRASLQRVGTDRFDLYQLHAVDNDDDLARALGPGGALEAVIEARDQGLVRFIGITGHWPQTLVRALKRFPFDTVMVPVNFVDRFFGDAQGALLPLCAKMDAGVIAIKATLRGRMKDHPACYRYTLSQQVATTIPAGNIAEIDEAIGIAAAFQPMSLAEQQALYLGAPDLEGVCRQCDACLPCPVGIAIPYLFALEGFGERYRPQQAAGLYGRLTVKASACTRCGLCDERCPHGIEVMRRMQDLDAKFASWAGKSWA